MTRKIIKCKNCGKLKPHNAKGLCNTCYKKQNLIKCKECGELKVHAGFGLCQNCYDHEKGISKLMYLNKSCSSYLGLMAEKLLSKVFKDVNRMPYGHKGFDFKCSKGMKIDVKSSVLLFRKNKPNYKGFWTFTIKRNIIPDYFLCIAFDNRTDKNPQHLWLIPAEKINHKVGLIISKNQTHKWSQYELPLEKTLECCESIKRQH